MNNTFIKQPKHDPFFITPRRIYILGVFLFLFLAVTYASGKVIPFLFAPEIILINPSEENAVLNSPELLIEGRVKNTNSLTLNGEKLYIEKNKRFFKYLTIQDGVNTVVLEAENIFGRSTQVVKHVIFLNPN